MLVTNQASADIYFGPLHLVGGIGQQLTIDDTSATSLYLSDDGVADAVNNAYLAGQIAVSNQAQPFPRPTGVPQLLHGSGSPEGIVYAPQGSMYMRRDGTGANNLYTKTTGVTLSSGWQNYTTTATGPGTTYRKTTPLTVNNTTTETDLLNGEITVGASVLGATGILRLTAWGDYLNNASSQVYPRFKFKLGTTVIFDTGAGFFGDSANIRVQWRIAVELANLGSTSSQAAFFAVNSAEASTYTGNNPRTYSASFGTGEGVLSGLSGTNVSGTIQGGAFNTAAVDMTVAQTLALTVTNAVASTSYETKLYGALAEII
jgi:hypothetical protein